MTKEFAILGRNLKDDSWNGTPTTISQFQSVRMDQTTNGTMILAQTNEATQNNMGTSSVVSGGAPESYKVPPLTGFPVIEIKNYGANSLSVTNTSANAATPIRVQAIGPGIPGTNPKPLPVGQTVNLAPGDMAQGTTPPSFMQLNFRSPSGLGVLGIIGGPSNPEGENGYVFAVNFTGPKPCNYTAVTSSNADTFQFNWNGSSIFLANLSPASATDLEVTLIQL